MSKPLRSLSLFVFLAAFSWVTYRSVIVGVSAREAAAYNHYISKPVGTIFTSPFDPVNNVLNSVLTRQALQIFRLSELTLRLGSLLGLVFYFCVAWRFGIPGLLFAASPIVLGWLPDSSGLWIACACFLLALSRLATQAVSSANLSFCSILLGIAVGFDFSFLLPVVALLLLYLHFQFWAGRRVTLNQAVNCLVLPGALVIFACWIFPLLNAGGLPPVRSSLLQIPWMALLPGLAGAGASVLRKDRGAGKLPVTLAIMLAGCAFFLVRAGFAQRPRFFQNTPESGLPRVARALRYDLRQRELKPVVVGASVALIEPVNFYCRRYRLGTVESVVPQTAAQTAEYLILLPQDQGTAALGATRIFANGPLSLYRKPPAP